MPEAPDVYQLMTLWGTAHKNLSEILDCEPDPKEDDEDMRQDIIAWCKKVAKTSNELNEICETSLKQGFVMPSHADIKSKVNKAAIWLARLEAEDNDKRAPHAMRRVKPPSTIQKVTRFDEESIRAKDRDVDSGQSDQAGQDDDETDKTVAEDASAGAKVLDLDGTELGVLKGGIVYWHALCEKCSSRKKPSCRGRQGHACDACRKGGYKCSYASHGKARQRPPLPPVQSNRKRRGIDPPDESPTPTSSQARDSGGSEKRARYDLGLKPINPTSSAMNAARARGYNFDSSLAKPASRLSRPNALADDSMSWGGQDDDGSHMAFSSSGSSQQDGEVSKNYLLTATTSTFEETGDVVGEIKLLRGEMDAVKAALKREGDRVSDQRDHSAMLQKQVANLTLEVEALRRMIQRMEDGR